MMTIIAHLVYLYTVQVNQHKDPNAWSCTYVNCYTTADRKLSLSMIVLQLSTVAGLRYLKVGSKVVR